MLADLQERTGLAVYQAEVDTINLILRSARLAVYHHDPK
jgi:hypothetical protein